MEEKEKPAKMFRSAYFIVSGEALIRVDSEQSFGISEALAYLKSKHGTDDVRHISKKKALQIQQDNV